MTLNKRAKVGIALAVAVLAGLTSGLAGMLVLVVAWLLIVWGQAPERTEWYDSRLVTAKTEAVSFRLIRRSDVRMTG